MPKGGKRAGSGRKRKPTEMRVIEGTFRKDRHGQAPKVAAGFPPAPSHLSESERALWEAFPQVPWIVLSDVLAVHGAVAIYDRILRNHKRQGPEPEMLSYRTVKDEDGNEYSEAKENPLITQEIKLWGRLMSILATLGLTPADRAKMATPKGEDVPDKWAGIL